jgi:hypothetical protein
MALTIEEAQAAVAKSLSEVSRAFHSAHGSAKWADGMASHDSSKTLRVKCHDLSAEECANFFRHGMANYGPTEPLRYFMPRVLAELSEHVFISHRHAVPATPTNRGSSPSWYLDLVALLTRAKWRHWRMEEQTAIETWFRALIE